VQCFAIDPGVAGGAVLRDERAGVLACYGWRVMKRKTGDVLKLTAHVGNECREYVVDAGRYGDVSAIFRADLMGLTRDYVLVVEGQFVGPKNVKAGLEIAFKAGVLAGCVMPDASRLVRPVPSAWRKDMYRDYRAIKGTDQFKQRAVEWSRANGSRLWTLQEFPDTCEADVMSAWGLQVCG
jgi:hypothetical protein